MLFDQSYKAAMKAPTGKGGRGWKYASAASDQAALAEALGWKWCLNAEAIYYWGNRHNVVLFEHRKRLYDDPDLLLVAVLNDWSIERTEREIAKARMAAGR